MPLTTISSDDVDEKFQQKMKEIKDDDLERASNEKAGILGLPYINLQNFPVSPDAISLLTEEKAKDMGAVCFFYTREEFRIGFFDENNFDKIKELIDELHKKTGAHGVAYLISKNSYLRALKVYIAIPKLHLVSKGISITGEDIDKFRSGIGDLKQLQEKIKEVSLTELMTLIIASSLQMRASDIHIEVEEHDVKLRFRIDGILHDVASIDKNDWPKIISRIKLISKLKLNVVNRPQDGRFTILLKDGDIDVRVSALPTTWGESVVMRILSSSVQGLRFDNLGLRKKSFEDLEREIKKPNGMIITTGPTGSGKTTTLYAMLNKLNSEGSKIITLEDPIEYKLEGINQSQVDEYKGYTFAKGLRSILRQDPDIVMVGEIRDDETADIAINASLTGHLVISTIHTNSASGAVPRFMALNAKPYLLAPALNAIIGQRLLRRICQDCRKEYIISDEEREEIKKIILSIPENSGEKTPPLEEIKFYKPVGCEKCNNLGYKGRVGVYEVMILTEEIKQTILDAKNISEYHIQELAQRQGMITMRQDGVLKAMEGITTLEEIFRVTK
ncbi:MAG: GspE/PulE family protein [bacterium]